MPSTDALLIGVMPVKQWYKKNRYINRVYLVLFSLLYLGFLKVDKMQCNSIQKLNFS